MLTHNEKHKYEILCIGNPIVDIFIEIDNSFAVKHGITEANQHITREQTDAILNEHGIDFKNAVKCSGGGAANVAKISAMLGMKSAFSGCVGVSAFGSHYEYAGIFEKEMAGAGVASILSKSNNLTGICFVCKIDDKTRFAVFQGAALEFDETHINEDLIKSADVVVVDGYILDRRPLVQHILKLANRRGIPVALDAASVFQVKRKAEEILTYSRSYPLFIFMNADEAIAFYNTVRKVSEDKVQSMLNFTEKEKESVIFDEVCPMLKIITDGELFPIIVVKLGGRGAVAAAGGHIYREGTLTVIPKDPVGAGDAFCAAFISAWIRGKSLSECASLGNKVARQILDVPGTYIKADKLKSFAKSLK